MGDNRTAVLTSLALFAACSGKVITSNGTGSSDPTLGTTGTTTGMQTTTGMDTTTGMTDPGAGGGAGTSPGFGGNPGPTPLGVTYAVSFKFNGLAGTNRRERFDPRRTAPPWALRYTPSTRDTPTPLARHPSPRVPSPCALQVGRFS